MQPDALRVHPCTTSYAWGNDLNIENTISLTLAQLDPALHDLISEVKSSPKPHSNMELPIVQFDDQGMIIKIAESTERLKDLLVQIFGFKGCPIEEMHYGRPYNYEFYIPRDEIENVIKQLGMDIIPPENLYKRYSEQNISYLQYLIETRRYHAYKPTRTNDVLETLKESLTSLVPNEMGIRPYVSFHPRGWLSIKLPDWSPEYSRLLASYLKRELIPIQQEFNHDVHYVNEILIYEAEIETFFKH
ncbi:MAG: hypothetical protein HWD61_14020 [Parachlamydiaceae bacterium]|nr:MAG: hypothetical protein HWD61_14020 [Parachlamydiaceae bacterium]